MFDGADGMKIKHKSGIVSGRIELQDAVLEKLATSLACSTFSDTKEIILHS